LSTVAKKAWRFFEELANRGYLEQSSGFPRIVKQHLNLISLYSTVRSLLLSKNKNPLGSYAALTDSYL
jgi:hypothetical protein